MKYYQVTFRLTPCSETACDILAGVLAERGFETFVPAADGLTAYVQQQHLEPQALETLEADFPLPGCGIAYRVEEAPHEDWNQRWEEEGFDFVAVDDLVCVHSERTGHTLPRCRHDIVINPRMAFGTGTHPTTQQILRHLAGMSLTGRAVIDAGCGTGVLAILAAQRGASRVLAYDIDEWSVENTLVNARLNGVGNIVVREGDAGVLPQDGSYDLLIANINRNILLADMPRFAAALRPKDSQLLLSGFYEADAPMLTEGAKAWGFRLKSQGVAEGWAMLLLERL